MDTSFEPDDQSLSTTTRNLIIDDDDDDDESIEQRVGRELYIAARKWWKKGYNVVPQKAVDQKHPAVEWKELQKRPVTEEELLGWWSKFANGVGFIAGEISGVIVIETDGLAGETVLDEFEWQRGPLPETLTIRSGSGRGLHRHFKHPGYKVKTKANTVIKVDIKGDGGFCVLPPSRHRSGGHYEIVHDAKPAELPEGLLEFIEAKAAQEKTKGEATRENRVCNRFNGLGEMPEHIRKHNRANILPVATGEPPSAETMRDILLHLSARNCFAKRSGIEKDEAGRIVAVGWLECGMALKASYGDAGFDLWGVTHVDHRARADAPTQWASFAAEARAGDVTIATIIKAANDTGFVMPVAPHVPEPLQTPSGETVTEVVGTEEATLVRLAAMSLLDYERVRLREAENLGVRVPALDAEVEKRRPKLGELEDEGGQGQAIKFSEIEPWPTPVDGGQLLDEIEAAYKRHIVMPDSGVSATALWSVFAYVYREFDHSPRLGLRSPEPRCGKTSVVKITEKLVPRPLRADNVTPAALFRMIERHSPTLLVDEADAFAKDNEELRGIINSGHERGGAVIRNVGDEHEPRAFKTWGPMLIAGIGGLAGTIEDRSIIITLKRKRRDEQVERFRSNRCDHLHTLARKIARGVRDHQGRLNDADPAIPEELGDRGADNWRPLFAIADEVGGSWPERARNAAVVLSSEGFTTSQSARIKLLVDIKEIFAARKEDEIDSSALVTELVSLPDRPWNEWYRGKPISSKRVADFLSEFSIRPHKLKTGSRPNGYERSQFEDAFGRYLDGRSLVPP